MNGGFFGERKTAWAVTVFLIIVSFLGGGAKSLNRMKSVSEKVFYEGVSGDGLGIQRELDRRIEYARNFISVANRYIPDEPAVKQLADAADALAGSKTVKEKSDNNQKLTAAASALYERLGSAGISERDAGFRESIFADIKARNNIILNDGYNREARDFNAKLAVFPASALRALRVVSELPVF